MARIYVIDDDDQLLRMVGLMLERGGHTTRLINNPVDGLEQIKVDKPDLLVLDVMMPDMSGHDLTRRLRESKGFEDLPILILTARSQEIDRMTALKSGADDYLSKPVTAQELIEQVDNLLARKGDQKGTGPLDRGHVIAFYGLRGGSGRTTLAVNLATALRRLSQQEVCLIDLSPSGGQVAWHLRLQTRATWADLPEANKLNWALLKNRLIIHPSGLRVLAAPAPPQAPELPSAETTTAVLELMRHNTAYTILDLPPVYSNAFRAGLDVADMGLHVLTPDVVSVQTAVQVNRLLAQAGIVLRQKSHILNQTSSEAQLPQAAVERGLNARIPFQIGYDANQSRAMTQGVPLALTGAQSPLPAVMRRIAEVIHQRVAAQAAD